jgi:hypothetical protein
MRGACRLVPENRVQSHPGNPAQVPGAGCGGVVAPEGE